MKTPTKFLIFFSLVFVAMVLAELFRPKPIDWRQTYSKDDKIPYGNYALYEVLPAIFPRSTIEWSDEPIYNRRKGKNQRGATYMIVSQTFYPDTLDRAALLSFVQQGNTAFIAAEYFDSDFRDTLGFKIGTDYLSEDTDDGQTSDSMKLFFLNPAFDSTQGYQYGLNLANQYFRTFDTLRTKALGKNSSGYLTFMRIPYGRGEFYMCSTPAAFTNFYLLNTRTDAYITRAFSYISDGPIIWDEYYNSGRKWAQTPLRFILRQESLRLAWYVLLAGAALFVFFRAKRRQRIIPILKQPANATLEFVETVGRLYYERRDNRNIIEKRIHYLLEFIRTRLYIPTNEFDGEFLRRTAEKTGTSYDEIHSLFEAIEYARQQSEISDEFLLGLHQKIEKFYRAAQT